MDSLGVDIGIHKSLLSPQGQAMEFAKRTIYKGVDVSPVPLKEFYAASRNLGAFVEVLSKYGCTFTRGLQAMGAGWQVRSWLNKPLGKLSARIRLLILAINMPRRVEDVRPFFEMGASPVPLFANETSEVIKQFVAIEVRRLKTSLLTSSNDAVNNSADEWGRSSMRMFLEERFDDYKSINKYSKLALADLLTNMANLTWHKAKIDNVNGAKLLLGRLNDLPKDDFAELYIQYLTLQREIAERSLHVFSRSRPDQPQIKGLLTPSQVKLWKRWSAVLQNSKSITDTSQFDSRLSVYSKISRKIR
jgi:hypothetical protein